MRRAVFLDRDGVLNEVILRDGRARSPVCLQEFVVTRGVGEALASLREAGYLLIVITNQPEVARGLQRQSVVESMHEELRRCLPLDDVRVCYHDDQDGCACRKPMPGMIIAAANEWGISTRESYMVGDRWKDVEAGNRAGCTGILLKRSYNRLERKGAAYCARSLTDAASWILSGQKRGLTHQS